MKKEAGMVSDSIKKRALYYGSEKEANPDIPIGEYREDLAMCLGKERWIDLDEDTRLALTNEFERGRLAERKATCNI